MNRPPLAQVLYDSPLHEGEVAKGRVRGEVAKMASHIAIPADERPLIVVDSEEAIRYKLASCNGFYGLKRARVQMHNQDTAAMTPP